MSNLNWSGKVTLDNIHEVCDMFRQLLDGKTYTFVAVNATNGSRPQVRTDQQVAHAKSAGGDAFSLWFEEGFDDPAYGGFHVVDTYGVWGLSVSTGNDSNPSVLFKGNQAEIKLKNGFGEDLHWVISVQKEKSKS